jgi:hypothetical protein
VWLEFADEFEATVDDKQPDSSHSELSLIVPISGTNWDLVYTMHPKKATTPDFTTVETQYKALGNFKFAIHPEKFIDGFNKLLGMQDIVIGHEHFDKHFIVKGNDEELIKQLFGDAIIRGLILDEPKMQLWSQCENTDSAPSSRVLSNSGFATISARLEGAVDDFERLKTFYKLNHKLLQAMCRLGVAEA